jgi:hypothetical protein
MHKFAEIVKSKFHLIHNYPSYLEIVSNLNQDDGLALEISAHKK